jgi:AmmeMemoRadiSam system protein A
MKMDEAARREVLKLARETVAAAVRGESPPAFKPESPVLNECRGAFVTIKSRGRLRGCIGQFTPSAPLYATIRDMAVAAATEDLRFTFDPITPREVPQLDIEVSVLGPLERIEDPLDFELGVHGIYLKARGAAGCFLPQVAAETGWSKEEFLSNCAGHKAGLDEDAWKDPATEVYRFTCEIVSEHDAET